MIRLLRDVGVAAGSLTALVAAVTALSRLRITKWLWRTLVSDPMARWAHMVIVDGAREFHEAVVEPRLVAIEKQLTANDGTTLRDIAQAAARDARDALMIVQRLSASER